MPVRMEPYEGQELMAIFQMNFPEGHMLEDACSKLGPDEGQPACRQSTEHGVSN
jgi:hypothetical protein